MNKLPLFLLGAISALSLTFVLSVNTVLLFSAVAMFFLFEKLVDTYNLLLTGAIIIMIPFRVYSGSNPNWLDFVMLTYVFLNIIRVANFKTTTLFVSEGDIILFPPEVVPDEVEIDYIF